jgi:restriction endonuclease S subunit
MKHWQKKPLGELVSLEYGKALKAEERSEKGRYPVYGSNGIVGSYDEAVIKEPTIVVGRKGAIGEAHLAENGCWPIDTAFYTVLRQPGIISIRYLLLWFRSVELKKLAITATIPGLNRNMLYKQQVPVPPMAEQECIVKLLGEADELRKLRAQANRRTADLLPALFHEMFGDPEARGWPSMRLGEIAEVKSGAGFPLDRQGQLDKPIPFFKVGDMNTHGNEWEMHIFQHSISEKTRRELRASLLPAGSIIFPKVGAAIGTNKKRVLVRPGCVDNNVMAIIPGKKVLTEYLFALLATKELMDFASNSNPPSIRKTTVEDWQLPQPPLSLQKEFADRVVEVRDLEAKQATNLRRLEKLFQSLLHYAFSGEL